MKKKLILQRIYEYLMVTLAGFLNAVAIHVFVNPNRLVPGGITGLASLVYYFIPSWDISIIYFAMNVPLLVMALILLRGDYTFKTIWAAACCSLFMQLMPEKFVFSDSPLIATIFGGVLMGVSMYVAYAYNGSNGGTEVIAKMVAKFRPEKDISTLILIANMAILIFGAFFMIFMQHEQVWIVFYSAIFVFVGSASMGILTRGLDHPQKYLIITERSEDIKKEITERFLRGVTCVDVYDNDGKFDERHSLLLVIVQYRQTNLLKHIIKKHDPGAFTIVKDVYDVFSRPDFNRSYRYDKKR